MDGVCLVVESVDGSDRFSGSDKEVSDDKFAGSFTKFGSPWVNACAIQCGRRCDETGKLKGFSRICSEVGVDPKKSDETFGVFCCEKNCSDGEGT